MTDRTVPNPSSSRFDLAKWFRDNVRKGDAVHFPVMKTYWTEAFTLQYHPDDITIQGHGSTLTVKTPPPADQGEVPRNWNRPFEVIGGNGLRVFDLNIKGCKPPELGFAKPYAGQHGFTSLGTNQTIFCKCATDASWGDGFYTADYENVPTTGLVICEPFISNTGRAAMSTVGAEDVFVARPTLNNIGRTGFNFEVHPGSRVLRWEATDVTFGAVRLNHLTATGEGEASDITFRRVRVMPTTKHVTFDVAGPGTPGSRIFGPRRNWTFEDISGGKTSKATDDDLIKLLNIDGLKIVDFPKPMQTDGSTMAAA